MCQIGSIYSLSGRRIHKGKRTSSLDGDRIIDLNPEKIPKTHVLKILIKCIIGRRLILNPFYGGPWFSQFGHFLAETLSRINKSNNLTKCYFIFHTMDMDPNYQKPFCWQLKILSMLGINKIKVLTNQDYLAINLKILDERVVFPNFISSSTIHTYDAIKQKNVLSISTEPFIFFSRSKLDQFHLRLDSSLNNDIEELFLKFNFKILHPEILSIEEQINYAWRSRIIAGVRGSALHLSLFSNTHMPIIEVGDSHQTGPNPLQVAICEVKMQNLIYFQFDQKANTHDLKLMEKRLLEIISKVGGG